jgi:hypothetical protein
MMVMASQFVSSVILSVVDKYELGNRKGIASIDSQHHLSDDKSHSNPLD